VLLVDARHGIREQTERHARIARLFGITTFVLAINKIDLVGFDERVFHDIVSAAPDVLDGARVQAIPISALHGDNVIEASERTPWYQGPALLPFLEEVDARAQDTAGSFRFPVQLVLRPDAKFRGYAGQIASGRIEPGDTVRVWPSGKTSHVTRIVTWEGDLPSATAGMAVTLVLADEIDISRGDVLSTQPPHVGRRFAADVVWMDEQRLQPGRPYVLKHGARSVTAEIDGSLALNEIGRVTVTAARPMAFERYGEDRTTGSFILIDPSTNFTAAAGMIAEPLTERRAGIASNGAAARLAQAARVADTDEAAVTMVTRILEEMLI
jgi:bifunctional enzyme CysN/CysC